jgi:preprotein translocase subunit YajC
MLIDPAYAQTATGAAGGLSGLVQFAPLVLIFVVFYFLLIRPQQRQQKMLKARLGGIKRGDRVVTAGGIVATVKKAAEGSDQIEAEIAPNVVVAIVRSTVTQVLTEESKKPAEKP